MQIYKLVIIQMIQQRKYLFSWTYGHKMFFTFISNQYIRVLNKKTIDEQYEYS